MTSPPFSIDRAWSLFLDRDGVLNAKRENDYVKHWGEFTFLPGVLEAMRHLSACFGRIIVVTNQHGIGRRLMSIEALEDIHQRMLEAIDAHGGRIDQIYHCPDLAEHDLRGWRKPKVGMALEAKRTFPEIEFKKSIMIGDSISDMDFGRRVGMHTVWVSKEEPSAAQAPLVDVSVESLADAAGLFTRDALRARL